MNPKVIKGNSHSDSRGTLIFNNAFNAVEVKRIYFISNDVVNFVRGWQGHEIDQRWFSPVQGSFQISTRYVDNWDAPSKNLIGQTFILHAGNFDVLHVPAGYITTIQALEEYSKLIAMSDYLLGEVSDDFRFDINYFDN